MIKDLLILNGELELKFNEYTYEYTVLVKDGIKELVFSYELNNGTYANIRNNDLSNEGENIVYLDVYDNTNTITYTFYVYKENTKTVTGIQEYISRLELKKEEDLNMLHVELLVVSCVILIIMVFSIIFHKKKVK